MTKINETQSKEIYDLFVQGDLTKKEIGGQYGVSEDVVKFHVKKHRPPSAHTEDDAAEENKDGIIASLSAKVAELTAKVGKLMSQSPPHIERHLGNKTIQAIHLDIQSGTKTTKKRYTCTVDDLLMYVPAVCLRRGQSVSVNQDTEELLRAIAEGKLVPAHLPPPCDHTPQGAEYEFLKGNVLRSFDVYYEIIAPCTKPHVDNFIKYYRATEDHSLSDESVREIVMQSVLAKTGRHILALSAEEKFAEMKSQDKATLHLYDLKKVDWEAYKIRAVHDKLCENTGSPKPLDYSEYFVQWFRSYEPGIPSDELREILNDFIRKNRQEADEAQRASSRQVTQINQVVA